MHTHYDGQVTWDPLLTPSSWQGVTTVVMGNCGVGFAPVRRDRHDFLIRLMEGVEDIPGTALHEGITWGWESFPEYLDVIDSTPHAIDFGAQVPHAALRAFVMGDRGADHAEVPTDAEIATMGRLAAEAMEAGALGFSTSRTTAHRSSDGSPTPSLTATADELLGIARAIGATKRGVFEIISDLIDLDSEFALHARDGGGQRTADVDHDAAAPGAASRRVPRPPRAHRQSGGRRRRAPRPGRGPPRGDRVDARRARASAPRVADVPAARRGLPVVGAGAAPARPRTAGDDPERARRRPRRGSRVGSRTRSRSGASLVTIAGPTNRSTSPACTTH